MVVFCACNREGDENINNPKNYYLTPLTDFGNGSYQGIKGGLYPNGENERPKAHNEVGLAIVESMKPLDRNGNVDEINGKIVWLSIGMSNTTQETSRFLELMKSYPDKNPMLELVDGAFGGQAINQIVKKKFPNVRIAYLSSRIYGGYAKTGLNPEPFAWYTGWANKLLIEDQINGDPRLTYKGADAKSPWLSWGPYFWANGTTPNAQGFSWLESDMRDDDGTHPGPGARQKVAEGLIKFFETDETAVPWFLKKDSKIGKNK